MGRGVHQGKCAPLTSAGTSMYDDDNLSDVPHSDGTFDDYNDNHIDDIFRLSPIIPDSLLKYANLQEDLYRSSYSVDALRNSSDIDDFVSRLPKFDEKNSVYNKLLKFVNKTNLSLSSSRELMDVIRAFEPKINVPSDIRVTKRFLLKKCKFMINNLLKETVQWPDDWNMSQYSELGGCPKAVQILAIDPYEVVSYKLCDPVLQFLYKDHIKYNYFSSVLNDGRKCWSHFMSSDYAKWTEMEIKSYNPEGILIPLIVYGDGVALGMRKKVYLLFIYYYNCHDL
jgi:hypothetical protein